MADVELRDAPGGRATEIIARRRGPSYLATHHMPLDEGPRGYEMFKQKSDNGLRVVFTP